MEHPNAARPTPHTYKQSAVPPHRNTYNLLTMDRSVIIDALKSIVQTWFKEDPNRVTVRAARSHVEQELGLDQGFLENEDWKAEAKRIVKDEFVSFEGADLSYLSA